MKNRTRSESLTVRLSSQEKKIIKERAAAKGLSVTDYLLLSVLSQDSALKFQPLLYKLAEIKSELEKNKSSENEKIYYALELHENTCAEIMRAIKANA